MQPTPFYTNLSNSDIEELAGIFGDLSPENLHSDGEVDKATANARYVRLRAQLQDVLVRLNVPEESVSEAEVFDELLKRRPRSRASRP